MADLTETQTWESGIYMWQTDDPVIGGPAGLDNLPTRQLANRTGWLRKQIEDHSAASDPHPQYLTQLEGGALFDQVNAASLAVNNHAKANDPHPLYQNQARADARYSQLGHAHADMYEAKNSVATHAAASDPHPQYLTQTEADARYSGLGSDGGMANHLAAADPHNMYLNQARANALYALIAHNHNGVYETAGAVGTHANSADPHTQYHTNARGDARYSVLGHGHAGVYDPAGSAENARVWCVNWASSVFAQPGWVEANFAHANTSFSWVLVASNGYYLNDSTNLRDNYGPGLYKILQGSAFGIVMIDTNCPTEYVDLDTAGPAVLTAKIGYTTYSDVNLSIWKWKKD